MRTILFFSLALVFSLSINAQSRWGESFAPDNKVDVVNAEQIINDPFAPIRGIIPATYKAIVDALESDAKTSYHYSYGMTAVDGDLASAHNSTDSHKDSNNDKDGTITVTPVGDFPPRLTDVSAAVSFPGAAPIDPADIYGSLLIKFTYSYNKLIKVEPVNNTTYQIQFTAKEPIESDGNTYYCYSWTYKGQDQRHYICASAPK